MWQHMKTPTLYLVHANTCSYKQSLLYGPICAATNKAFYMDHSMYQKLEFRHMQTHAVAYPALEKWERVQIHAQLPTQVTTCWIMANPRWAPTHADTFSALDTGPYLLNHVQPSIWTNMQVLAQLSISTNTCGRHAQLLIKASTWRYSLSSW